jgi:predicted AlkP superfamily phosphohydrolase/phosphomutase
MVPFTVWIDPVEPVAKIAIQEQEILLRQGEWSEWMRVEFVLVPYLERVTGICKFYLKQLRPRFQLYVTPINLDPSRPALPLSTPAEYAPKLAEEVGYFYTQGIAEDTKALTAGILDDAEYLAQSRMVLDEQLKIFDLELRRFRSGLLFFYFSSIDENGHMFWRAWDERHPAHTPELGAKYSRVLEELYQEMDRVVGRVIERLDEHTTLLVLSDHGFAPYYRSFNLNSWLRDQGYIGLKDPAQPAGGDYLSNVDWSRTRAYGLGLNALYLNLRGRERYGIVPPGSTAEALLAELRAKLLAIRDPATGLPVITRVDKASEVYSGPNLKTAPDLLIGYNRGYRAGWGTVLGGFSLDVFEDNTEAWSGDHCIDSTLVPGVLVSNKKILAESPKLTDVAPTILAEFGIEPPTSMTGKSVFRAVSAPQN